jgi:putative membrane protein
VYILSKMLGDPAKRKRFLSPIGWLLLLVSSAYTVPPILGNINNGDSLFPATTPLITFLIGVMFILYAYNMQDWFAKWKTKWIARVKHGSVAVTFILVSSLLAISGVVIGYLSLNGIYSTSVIQSAAWFASNSLWPILFAILVYFIGDLLDIYFSTRTIKLSFIVGSINIMSIGLILTSILDFILAGFDADVGNNFLYAGELIAGIALAFASAIVHRHVLAAIGQAGGKGSEEDAVR